MELILCEKPKVGRDTARLLGIKEQHQEYIVCKDGKVGSWAIGHLLDCKTTQPGTANPINTGPEAIFRLLLRSFTPLFLITEKNG